MYRADADKASEIQQTAQAPEVLHDCTRELGPRLPAFSAWAPVSLNVPASVTTPRHAGAPLQQRNEPTHPAHSLVRRRQLVTINP